MQQRGEYEEYQQLGTVVFAACVRFVFAFEFRKPAGHGSDIIKKYTIYVRTRRLRTS